MERSDVRLGVMILILWLVPTISLAWTPLTRGYMAITAYRTFPSDLRQALRPHRKEFRDAALATDLPASPAELTNEACRLLDRLHMQLSGKPKFRQVAIDLGRLSAVIAQMTDPFPGKTDTTATDYRAYVERKLPRFRFAYRPVSPGKLSSSDLCTHLFRFRRHGAGMQGPILADYRFFGNSSRFDDRSGAFGTASLLFADACFEIARTATILWQSANGHISDSPLLCK